jgi:hypothetical protein
VLAPTRQDRSKCNPSRAIVVQQRFFGIFWLLFLAGSAWLRDNRRMTDAAHHQHSETSRPSDRDRIVTTGPSRFQPARPEVFAGSRKIVVGQP